MIPARFSAAAVAASAALVLVPAAASAQTAPAPTDYVALGDSYSSGTGAGEYFDRDCLRSNLAYPKLLAAATGAELTFAACSGATTADLLAQQLEPLDAETDLVTVTIGGNDIGWAEAVKACITPLTDCTDDIEAAEERVRTELPGLLDGAYGAITDRAPAARVYVLGYPRLFNETDDCDALGQVTVAEQQRMNQAADLLAETVAAAAAAHGLTYVDVREAFAGHAVCDEVPYVHGLRHPIVESYHPNALGHAGGYFPAIAKTVQRS
ncbi:SGNH/GDSL hydrolase family protein [Glycomyces sp. A-F 0318]|uniref:SGNH/GDSL hydrolase family protein n=1 Tax=Glycomyces amatae TaxID=2881355 RepID=UPI001E551C40|nr:SGNH/GDSL hydrolase family protein [Glycomyces amatae]MCD0443257.1 SGNH/GDSL hydrolase family protein [Glycomyces amatae]